MVLHPYWLTVKNAPPFHNLRLGAGITASSETEAHEIFARTFGRELQVENIRRIYTTDEIEHNHVRPNMGNHLVRGIWFPLGYA